MKFVSHLDMNRYMMRLIKTSNIPVWYTEGFNQHIYLTFALPLSLGVTSDYDCFDLKITDDGFGNEQIKDALNLKAAEGIKIIAVQEPWMKVSELKYAGYTLIYKDDDTELLKKLEAMLLGNVIIAEKKGKKNKVTVLNVAEKIKSIETDLSTGTLTVKVVLPAGNDENINPSLFLQAFTSAGNPAPSFININRDMLYNQNFEKFE